MWLYLYIGPMKKQDLKNEANPISEEAYTEGLIREENKKAAFVTQERGLTGPQTCWYSGLWLSRLWHWEKPGVSCDDTSKQINTVAKA